MGEDWKGESLIRVPRKSTDERKVETQSIAQKLAHVRRRKHGAGMSTSGGYWARRIHAACVHANIRGGSDA
jgi:hypothetical protein